MAPKKIIRSKMKLMGLSSEPTRHIPVMVLREEAGEERYLPIWVSMFDASIIAMQKSHDVHLAKPMTAELLVNLMKAFEIKLVDVEITGIKESLYCAQGTFVHGDRQQVIPLRPSDGVLLSLLTAVPIYCYTKIFEELKSIADSEGEMPLLRENEIGMEGDLAQKLSSLVSQATGEAPLESMINSEVFSDDEEADEEPLNGPAAMLLGDEAVDPELLKDLLKNLDKRFFGRYKM